MAITRGGRAAGSAVVETGYGIHPVPGGTSSVLIPTRHRQHQPALATCPAPPRRTAAEMCATAIIEAADATRPAPPTCSPRIAEGKKFPRVGDGVGREGPGPHVKVRRVQDAAPGAEALTTQQRRGQSPLTSAEQPTSAPLAETGHRQPKRKKRHRRSEGCMLMKRAAHQFKDLALEGE